MKKTLSEIWPKVVLVGLIIYVGVLGFATIDELLGWGIITPYFK